MSESSDGDTAPQSQCVHCEAVVPISPKNFMFCPFCGKRQQQKKRSDSDVTKQCVKCETKLLTSICHNCGFHQVSDQQPAQSHVSASGPQAQSPQSGVSPQADQYHQQLTTTPSGPTATASSSVEQQAVIAHQSANNEASEDHFYDAQSNLPPNLHELPPEQPPAPKMRKLPPPGFAPDPRPPLRVSDLPPGSQYAGLQPPSQFKYQRVFGIEQGVNTQHLGASQLVHGRETNRGQSLVQTDSQAHSDQIPHAPQEKPQPGVPEANRLSNQKHIDPSSVSQGDTGHSLPGTRDTLTPKSSTKAETKPNPKVESKPEPNPKPKAEPKLELKAEHPVSPDPHAPSDQKPGRLQSQPPPKQTPLPSDSQIPMDSSLGASVSKDGTKLDNTVTPSHASAATDKGMSSPSHSEGSAQSNGSLPNKNETQQPSDTSRKETSTQVMAREQQAGAKSQPGDDKGAQSTRTDVHVHPLSSQDDDQRMETKKRKLHTDESQTEAELQSKIGSPPKQPKTNDSQETGGDHSSQQVKTGQPSHSQKDKWQSGGQTPSYAEATKGAQAGSHRQGKPPHNGAKATGAQASTQTGRTSASAHAMHPPKGLTAPPSQSIFVTFHVLLPKPIWEWDANSKMYIRFGDQDLGKWECDCGPMEIWRELPDEYCEMTGTFQIRANLLKNENTIPYKYIVYSPKTMEDDDVYEYLHDYRPFSNRCLKLSVNKYFAYIGGTYHQYDTITFPRNVETKSFLEKAARKFKSFFTRSKEGKPEEFKPPSLEDMCKECLGNYLDKYHNMLSACNFPSEFHMLAVAEDIQLIYQCLRCPLTIHTWSWSATERPQHRMFMVMKEWLESIVNSLKELPDDGSGRRLVSAVTIAYCFHLLAIPQPKHESFLVPLLEMLSLKPEMRGAKGCPDYEMLASILLNEREKVADAVRNLCIHLMKARKFKSLEWFSALPLFHFLKGYCKPFDKPEMNPEKIKWGERETQLELHELIGKGEAGFVDEHYEKFQELFVLDPLLLRAFIYICPREELPALSERIPPYLSVTWLSFKARQLRSMTKYASEDWCSWITHIRGLLTEPVAEPEALFSMVDASRLLYWRLSAQDLTSRAPHHVELLKASIALILFSVSQLKSVGQDSGKHDIAAKVADIFTMLHVSLKNWIVSKSGIGGSFFGGKADKQSWKANDEIKFWNSLLHLECPDDSQVRDEWYKVTRSLIEKRVFEVPESGGLKIDLVCLLEEHKDVHPILTDTLMAAATQTIDNMFSQPGKYAVANFEKLANTQSERVGKLLGTFLKKQYPHLQPETEEINIDFDDLLEWHLWPSFIKIYGSDSKLKEGLPQECQLACLCALSKFEEVCGEVLEGNITVEQLRKISRKLGQMKRLCEAVAIPEAQKEKKGTKFSDVQFALEQRLEEFDRFEEHRKHLVHLSTYIDHSVQGITQLESELHSQAQSQRAEPSDPFSSLKINLLCVREGRQLKVLRFQSAGTLNTFAAMFFTMTSEHSNDLFLKEWKNAMRTARQQVATRKDNPRLTIADIYPLVWQPAVGCCKVLLHQLRTQEIQLASVDEVFRQYQDTTLRSQPKLELQLRNLFSGVTACDRDDSLRDGNWIATAVHRINEYWKLCRYCDAANAFLKLKRDLNLSGDFSNVEKLSKEVTISMKGQTLQAVNESLIETGRFLEGITSDPNKLHCLQTFAECQGIVAWIRHTTKDVSDLQNFVNVALATAAGGEGADAQDSLADLRTVGGGFGSLIYSLPKDANYRTLAHRCGSLWDALRNNPKLPDKLRDCNKLLEWYKSVKDTQGSVEVTSFGQMKNILAHGRYRIGARGTQAVHDIHDVVSLKLERTEKLLQKMNYSLDDLRDLESKLVLITGSMAENRRDVDHFLDTLQSVCRIAEVLIALQQAGNVKYASWVLRFQCGEDMVADLQEWAKRMENELQEWKDAVKHSRKAFYELNYYTTLQLLSLRKELGKLKDPTSGPVSPHVLALMESISSEVTAHDVQGVVHNVTMSLAKQQWPPHSDHPQAQILPTEQIIPAEMLVVNITGPVAEKVSSKQPSLAKDILATADEQTEVASTVPQPKLTLDSLSDEQKQTYTDLTETYGYPPQLVLMALEKCGEDMYEADNWCTDNLDKFQFPEDEVTVMEEEQDTQAEEMSSDDSEPEFSAEPTASPEAAKGTSPHVKPASAREPGPKITITHKLPVDEHHPLVGQLMEAGYSLEQGAEAVEKCDSLDACMDYLLALEIGGEVFQSSQLTSHTFEDEGGPRSRDHEAVEQRYEAGMTISCDKGAEDRYLGLFELGIVLHELSCALPAAVPEQRTFPSNLLKIGSPNLVVTSPENVLKTALALYMKNEYLPLPTHEEVLICNPSTTAEEVSLLWQRAVGDPNFKRIFCLVHAEKLSYQACDRALRFLSELTQGKTGYRLVIVCSSEDEDRSHIISKLSTCRRPYEVLQTPSKYQEYLKNHFTGGTPAYTQSLQLNTGVLASVVDHESSCVRVVCSTRSGMGKSLYIQRMAEQLKQLKPIGSVHITIPIHGPSVTPDIVLEFLKQHMGNCAGTILHFDIAPGVLIEVDTILFCLLILRSLSDSHGRVWRCHPSQLYAIEVTVPEQQREQHVIPEKRTLSLLELLPSVECIRPREAMGLMSRGVEDQSKALMDAKEFENVTYQRVYQYLRRHIGRHNLDRFTYIGNIEGNPADCLLIVLQSCGIKDPSWAEIRHFVKFLDIQLQSCEDSVFCDEDLVGDVMAGLKGFVVKFMIRMSQDFATSSLHGEVAKENEEEIGGDDLEQYQIDKRREWEQSSHPYIFFNQDRASITFVGFRVTKDGNLIDPKCGGVLEAAIMTPQLYTGLRQNRVDFDENYQVWGKDVMITKIATVMGLEYLYDPDPSYVLTIDNLIKMLAIQMRFRCGIPVVIMGETGCGKTRLIRYMCDLAAEGSGKNNMLIMKVHGGITEADVTNFVKKAEAEATENRQHGLDTVLFFDEANTTDAIGLIKEIMCDHRLHGRPISDDLRFIAACNPYRKHTDDMIQKLESAGLGFYVKATETQQKLGKIPLRQLVYRVLELPPSMRPLVYDFGQLNTETEQDYTSQIVKNHVRKHPELSQQNAAIIPSIARVLAWSQKYMRGREDECSFVSLRDVERAMIVLEYFFEKMLVFGPPMDEKARQELQAEDEEPLQALPAPSPDSVTRSLLLSLSVCYHARLQDREEYEKQVAREIMAPLALPGGAQQFRDEIRRCQEVLLDNMTLGPNIARNAALRENIFMMAICIDLRIPLFLVGKPGSSKSLAKAIVSNSMQGQASICDLFKGFKQVHMFSYQCSQLSTPESVIEIFNTAKRIQKKQDTTKYVAVVVLDEVGLAEDSPNLPLKALHPLLEDGTEGADESQQFIEREKRVAFIGISNWALDPAKMNRGVMVTRGDPDVNELELSARGICSYKQNDPVKERLEPLFKPLAEAYKAICEKQKREFFGLRDFYSLIKMLYWMCEKSDMPLTWPQLEHAIRRNFGGLESKELDPLEEFTMRIPIREPPDLTNIPEYLHPIVNPDCSRLGLIKTSLKTKETTWHGENRYLLFLTENYAALEILRHYLHDVVGMSPTGSVSEAMMIPAAEKAEPFILFGSSFPKDKEYTQVCRNINQIKICMETGRTVILLNLENLYESLYDVLNQYYIYHGGNRYVDLGLQTHRVKCRVHDNFKLILIAEKSTVYEKFPTPLINRLEKHFVLTESVLTKWQLEVLEDFQDWIQQFSRVNRSSGGKFTEGDAFIGYQKDTAAAVVFQATNQLEKLKAGDPETSRMWEKIVQSGVPDPISPYNLMGGQEGSEPWKNIVLKLGQYLLLRTASDDALVRLKATPLQEHHDELWRIYSIVQCHSSLDEFLHHLLKEEDCKGGLLMQVTTHSHLLSPEELEELGAALGWDKSQTLSFLLQEFDTELDFSNKVSPAFQKEPGDTHDSLLIIQCDSGHIDGDLVACARYRIYDERAKCLIQERGKKRRGDTHILFIIHLPKQAAGSSFVGFQGDPWISTHIDDLRPAHDSTLTLQHAMGAPISEIFFGGDSRETQTLFHSNLDNQSETYKDEEESMHVEDLEEEQTGEGMEVEYDDMPPLDGSEDELSSLEGGEDEEMAESTPQIHTGAIKSKEEDESEEGVMPESMLPEQPIEQVLPSVEELPTEGEQMQARAPIQRMHGYYRRLNSCIQAAASRLQDSEKNKERATQRVAILVGLIPRDPPIPLDPSTFYGVLVHHIHKLLKERGEVREDDKHWVLNEALNAKKLQNGGTFRNVLARKLDDVIIPIFAEIIGIVDRNYNLNLIAARNENTPMSQFWLAIFRNPDVMKLRYEDMIVREQVPGMGGRMAEEDFKCQLPFSWVIKEAVDAQWDHAKSIAGNKKQQLYMRLCHLVSEVTPVGEVLRNSVTEDQCQEFYKCYLHDFVRSVHKCTHKQLKNTDTEYKLIADALDGLTHATEFASIDGHESLVNKIAALHVVYQFNREQVLWFGQLISHMPGLLVPLEGHVPIDRDEMVLHLHAVEKALERLDPPIAKDEATLNAWLNLLRLSQNAIDSILSLPSQHELVNKTKLHWQLIRALQLFVEHVLMKYEGMVPFARRIHMHLKSDPDFQKASTVERVKRQLNAMDSQLKGKLRSQPKKLESIRRSCRAFFMELVSTLCFRGQATPEPELIKMLVDTVFTETREAELGTKDFSPYKEEKSDKIPVIRSFLLQLLLEHSSDQVRIHLGEYFERSCQVYGGGVDQNLCLLCIQCFEDALFKEHSVKSFLERITGTLVILQNGYQALQNQADFAQGEHSLEYLEGVAKVRFALSVVAELLHMQVTEVGIAPGHGAHHHGAQAIQLVRAARDVCNDPHINVIDTTGIADTMGPVVYLLKLLVRQYGFPTLKKVTETRAWVVPPELKRNEEENIVDLFVIYGDTYKRLRECLSEAIIGKRFEALTNEVEELTPQDAVCLLLALYEKATLCRASTTKVLPAAVMENLDEFIRGCKFLSRELQWTARALLSNQHGGNLAQLTVSPEQDLHHRTLGAIVVHAAIVFFCRQRVDVLKPFANMLNNPAALVNAYLPTMPEDILPEAQRVLGGAFFECPRGHPYFISECGRPMQEYTCNICGARIGGTSHALRHDNRGARRTDNTQAGHCLGTPEGRSTVPTPERGLSPAACCIVRALMHAALIWASCNNETAAEGLVNMVKAGVPYPQLPEFFWRHLEKDIQLLSRAINRNEDECTILLHLILRQILTQNPPTSDVVRTVSTLGARNAREEWEKIFNRHYIQPTLEALAQKLGEAMHSILNDDDQEHDQLFYLVYEQVQVTEGSLKPHFWTFRSRITLEHLSLTLHQKNMKQKCSILYELLREEPNLRATQYLPDIVRLQQCLYDSFHHRLDRKEAKEITIGEFLKERKSENVRNEYQRMFESLQKAWSLVGDKLRDHARLRVEEQYLRPAITADESLEYLIPTTTGAGACTTALVDFLVLTHNSFIEKCRGIVREQTKGKSPWKEHKVAITHIHRCHLLDYEQQLLSIVLSHCHYSLTLGRGQDVSYDLPALEKHVLDRFIHGKPLILSDIPQVVYRKDIYTAATFAAVRKKVAPQTALPPRVQQEILMELRTADRLRGTLDVVEIVLGFLSTGGGRAERSLREYIEHALKMKRPFCEKARDYCILGHVMSLWETLSVELARKLTLSGQEPFDSLRMEFLEDLKTDDEEDQKAVLYHSLRSFNLDQLLGVLYEFIETYVKHSPDNEKDWPLIDTLEAFLQSNGLPTSQFEQAEFPESITLAQAATVWKHIIQYQEKQKHEG